MTRIGENPLVHRRATHNPYLVAAGMLVRRLLWDLQPQSWVSRRRLRRLRNIHRGEKAVIVCNGPSLLNTDLTLLEGVYTFGLNKINLLFDKSDFRPTCIVSVNPYVIEQNKEFFNGTAIPLFIDANAKRVIQPRSNVTYTHSSAHRIFARDCSISLYQSCTVTFVALQLAFHMGFDRVALIGCDHSFAQHGPANEVVVSGDRDDNHFDPSYFAGGVKWQLPDLFESEVGYTMAKEMFTAHGREVVNATVGGKLDVFPRMTLESFLAAQPEP